MINKNKHLIVVSADAFVFEDLEYVKTLPNFKRILERGSVVGKVRTIYPTLTHPVHASIITGAPAGVTGVASNLKFVPGDLDAPWYNDLSDLKCDTIVHAAHNAGLTTASCVFPLMMGGEEYIDYYVPGLMKKDIEGMEDNVIEAYKKHGLTKCLYDDVKVGLETYGTGLGHPEVDAFSTYVAAQIIRKYQPNLLITHPGYIDSARHRSGVFSEFVKESLRETDKWIGMLWDAVCDAGIEDSTDIVVLGDHGQLNVTRRINTNVYFADRGYIKVGENGELLDWEAYAMSTGLSAYVYLKDKNNSAVRDEIYQLLKDMAEEKLYGFDQVLTVTEVREKYGLDGDFSFVLETDGYTSFADSWVRPLVIDMDNADYRAGKASHGYLPEKGPQPTFIAMGPSFKTGSFVECGSILNHAPTFARVLGVELRDAKGCAVDEILK